MIGRPPPHPRPVASGQETTLAPAYPFIENGLEITGDIAYFGA